MSDSKNGKGAATMAKTEFIFEPGKNEITMTRVFDAPRELVFKAMTDPKLMPKWWGPRDHWTKVDKMDVKAGGSWRFINGDKNGNEYGFHGVYHLVDAPERVVQTFEFEGAPGHVALDTLMLEDLGGKTRLVQQSVFQKVEDRDMMLATGMETGATETNDRLAELLVELSNDKQSR
jgi:uncharacterized protein YndB with AHSA1/START domain